eukprot:CAMPEP_0170578026 /NCGR_PEP_ID=MMETSP0224-20130122/5241_1 /TAXON_ID=285029 /ORGANISM="Togula jolla, Strain CCCM 725" /LENGTH=259 /DNA_ID=CAMNT_0010900977 /DNA_START=299 /DNA_END=1078 /DNA_ORIENTATION=-
MRAFADHVFDETMWGSAADVRKGDVVFLKHDFMERFFSSVHPDIVDPYILTTHNSDYNAPTASFIGMLNDGKVAHWFAENMDHVHPRLHPVPIGVPNAYLAVGNVPNLVNRSTALVPWQQRSIGVYVNFNPTNPTRQAVRDKAAQLPGYHGAESRSHFEYLTDLADSRFVISPPGNGRDCYRTWEAIIMGAVPVVLSDPQLDLLYREAPVLVLKSWEELTPDRLLEAAAVMDRPRDIVLGMYWVEKIWAKQREVRMMAR